jgi:hypothetical protein
MNATERVFISYRRDDAAGYAGRLEEALERQLGRGSVFRDLLDIAPGEDFARTIDQRLARAQAVLVLIGPRWAGADAAGARRIDDERDFVRLEVRAALQSSAQVVPVLLAGAALPSAAELPEPLKPLLQRNAMTLADAHWAADVQRLLQAIGMAPQRRRITRWLLGACALGAALAGGWWALRAPPAVPPTAAPISAPISAPIVAADAVPQPDSAQRLLGQWSAQVRYAWGDSHQERFEFKRHAGELTGSASFLGYPRAIEQLRIDGTNIHFRTHSQASMGSETRELTHAYAIELRGQPPHEQLAVRMQSSGGFRSEPALEFEARRSP